MTLVQDGLSLKIYYLVRCGCSVTALELVFSVWSSRISANKRKRYVCNAIPHRHTPCSVINRNWHRRWEHKTSEFIWITDELVKCRTHLFLPSIVLICDFDRFYKQTSYGICRRHGIYQHHLFNKCGNIYCVAHALDNVEDDTEGYWLRKITTWPDKKNVNLFSREFPARLSRQRRSVNWLARKRFPHYWPFVMGIHQWIPITKGQ